jgi:hypothetical protein
MEPKHCAICGIEFVPKDERVLCCSKRCGHALGRRRMGPEGVAKAGRAISTGKRGKTHRGVPHSDETKRVLSEKTHLRMSDPARNPFVGKRRSEESRERQSKTRSERMASGAYKGWFCRGYIQTTKGGGRVYFKSSWERNLIEKLEADPRVISFQYEPFAIPYYRQEGERLNLRHYVPDFLVQYATPDLKNVLYEVKPSCFVESKINLAKFEAARRHCDEYGYEFRVLTEKEGNIS